jgi:hypothetical protein
VRVRVLPWVPFQCLRSSVERVADYESAGRRCESCRRHHYKAPVAQCIEHRASNAEVVGESPSGSATSSRNANRTSVPGLVANKIVPPLRGMRSMSSAFRHFQMTLSSNWPRHPTFYRVIAGSNPARVANFIFNNGPSVPWGNSETDGGMAPTAGVSRSEAKVPENLRAVRDHGQSMQAQASRESGRSWPPRPWSFWESSASWNERRFRCPATGNISRRRAAGGAGLTTNQTAIHKAKGSARNIRALSARVMAQSERWRTCANTDVVLRLR